MSDEPPGVRSEQSLLRVTRREEEILGLIAQGLTDQEIAERLWISVHTVHTHVAHLREKFQAPNRVVLMREAQRLGYVPPIPEKSLFVAIGEWQHPDYTQIQEVGPKPLSEQTDSDVSADKLGESEMLNPRLRFWYLAALLALVAQNGAAAAGAAKNTLRRTDSRPGAMATRRVWAGANALPFLGAPSPDERYLPWVDWDSGDLAVLELATGKTRRLTNKGSWATSGDWAEYSTISPDVKQVAYAWATNEAQIYDLRLIGLDGSRSRTLFRGEGLHYIRPAGWSPDGRQILAIFSLKDLRDQIALVSVADGSVRVLKTVDKERRFPEQAMLAFSPDGRYIAYSLQTDTNSPGRDIYLLTDDGSREEVLVQHPADDHMLGWAPDGRHLLFASDRTGSPGAWLLPVAEGKPAGSPQLVKPDLGRIVPLGSARNGAFYYRLTASMIDVYTATLDPTASRLARPATPVSTQFMGGNTSPAWSPDGRYLAYLSQRAASARGQGARVICIRDIVTGKERTLSPGLNLLIDIAWSADGHSLMIHGKDRDDVMGTYPIDAETGVASAEPVTEKHVYLRRSEWSQGALFYLRDRSVLRRDLATGQEQEMHRAASVRHLALSHDGRQLAFGTDCALFIMPAAGGAPSELLRVQEPEALTALAWGADGRSLLFARKGRDKRQPEAGELWRMAVGGGEPQMLELAMEGLDTLRVHPDGRRIAFVAGRSQTEVWVLENFLPGAPRP